ncbi:MAG: hypothetical protein AAF439_00390 [Pseudomonadota bacterium]
MASPDQVLETCSIGGKFVWKQGEGMLLEDGTKLAPKDTLFDAQVDEQIAKSLVAQKLLVKFCRELTKYINRSSFVDPGIKKRKNIREKVQVRGKKIHQVNDVSRATVKFTHLEELYAAEAWIRQRPEYKAMQRFKGKSCKNRYTKSTEDGSYRDIKFFICFDIPRSVNPWIVELQLNLQQALEHKSIGHGIYEITRLGDALPDFAAIDVPPTKMMRIARKLRPCYVALRKTGIDPQLLKKFRDFIYANFEECMGHIDDEKPDAFVPGKGATIVPEDRALLDKVSQAIYTYSFKVMKNAYAYKNGGLVPVIGAGELKD